MKRFFSQYFILLTLTLCCGVLIWVTVHIHHHRQEVDADTIERIRRSGTLRMITTQAVNTFYTYQDEPAGLEYDLAQAFADFLNVELDVITPGWSHLFSYLTLGKGDLVAAGLAITRENLKTVDFSLPIMTTQQHVVHHRLTIGPEELTDLTGQTLNVRRDSAPHHRLKELEAEGLDFTYILHENVSAEDLIAMVNDREIKMTIAEFNVAMLNQRYFPDIIIGIPVQVRQSLAWAVRKGDTAMLEAVNQFLYQSHRSGLLTRIIDKYYKDSQMLDTFEIKKFHERIWSRLPDYRHMIEKEAARYGFDWRLMAATIYQESHFDPDATSPTLVRGLMQVTHAAAREMGIENRLNPSESIRAGIKYLNLMYSRFENIEDSYQRMLFALASYNVGYGHVLDAMDIARKKKMDALTWQSVKQTLPLLARPVYHEQTRYGYARGWEPVQFVERILTYYDILKQIEFH